MNPIRSLYSRMINQLASDNLVSEHIKSGNLVDFSLRHDPQKRGITSSDVPELVVYLNNIRGNIHASSSDCRLTMSWNFIISSGSYDLSVCTDVSFAVLSLLVDWKRTLKQATWDSKEFVIGTELVDSSTGISNAQANRNIKGWATILQADILTNLSLTSIKSSRT